jgi:hypothetical protein
LSSTASPRVIAQDLDGEPIWTDGTRIVAVSDYESKFCGLRVQRGDVIERTLELPCGTDVHAFCAGLRSTRCVVSSNAAGHRVYRAFDPVAFSLGEVVFTDPLPEHGFAVRAAISPDGKLALPRPHGGLDVFDLATNATQHWAATETPGDAWMTAAFSGTSVLVSAIDVQLHGYIVEAKADGSVGPKLDVKRGFLGSLTLSPDGTRFAVDRETPLFRGVVLELAH